MTRKDCGMIFAASWMLMAVPGRAQLHAGGAAPDAVSFMRSEVRQQEIRLATLEKQVETTRAQVQAGVAQTAELEALQAQRDGMRVALEQLRQGLAQTERVAALRRPIDLQLSDATLPQAAEALTRTSGVPIRVDRSVASDARLTLEARRVPLAAVLQSIAEQANLMIAPEPQGVSLQSWPTLRINGQNQTYRGGIAPLSDAWGMPPTTGVSLGGPGGGGFGGGGFGGSGGQYIPQATPIPPMPPSPNAPGPTPLAITAVGEGLFVVAEPGKDSKGESGVWLTLYRLDTNQAKITRINATFHPSPASAGREAAPGR